MNNKTAKTLRSIIPPTDEVSKRNYRRAKKKYNKLPASAKPLFLEYLAQVMNHS